MLMDDTLDGMEPEQIASSKPLQARAVDAIVIGASAGAVEALSELLPAIAQGLRVPTIVVVHLPPRHPSLLPELFRRLCSVPVHEPMDKQPVAAGTIWFAPADYHLLIEQDHTFSLSLDAPVKYSRPAVDVLFESAADVYQSRLVAVVLSGASDDGAEGALKVRKAGGFVLVQDPTQALMRTMPQAAMDRAEPQLVGSLARIAATLRELTGATS
jgi:two-component system chemotaxis response regulator CheB